VEAEGSGLICSTSSADIRTRNPCSTSQTHNTLVLNSKVHHPLDNIPLLNRIIYSTKTTLR